MGRQHLDSMRVALLCAALAAISLVQPLLATHVKGAIPLDSFTFDKVVGQGVPVLVKFDKDYPYGEAEDAFKDLAAKVGGGTKDVLIASVGVQEYGDKLNEDLAERFSVNKEQFPHYMLFSGDAKADPVIFKGDVKVDKLVGFLKEQVRGFYIALPGCIRELDKVAVEFMATAGGGRNLKKQEAEQISSRLNSEADKQSGKYYLLLMQKVIDKGDNFIQTETARLAKMIDSVSITEDKKALFRTRQNIISGFQQRRDEL